MPESLPHLMSSLLEARTLLHFRDNIIPGNLSQVKRRAKYKLCVTAEKVPENNVKKNSNSQNIQMLELPWFTLLLG